MQLTSDVLFTCPTCGTEMCVAAEFLTVAAPCIGCGTETSAQQALIVAAQSRLFGESDHSEAAERGVAASAPPEVSGWRQSAPSNVSDSLLSGGSPDDSWLLPSTDCETPLHSQDVGSMPPSADQLSSLPTDPGPFPPDSAEVPSEPVQYWGGYRAEETFENRGSEQTAESFLGREGVDPASNIQPAEPARVASVDAFVPSAREPETPDRQPEGSSMEAVSLFEKDFIGKQQPDSHLPPPRQHGQGPRMDEGAAPFVPNRVIAASSEKDDSWQEGHRRRRRSRRRRRRVESKVEQVADSHLWRVARGGLAIAALTTICGFVWWMKSNDWGNGPYLERLEEKRSAEERQSLQVESNPPVEPETSNALSVQRDSTNEFGWEDSGISVESEDSIPQLDLSGNLETDY